MNRQRFNSTIMYDGPMKAVDDLMRQALLDHVFPGAVLLAAKGDDLRFFQAYGYGNIHTRQVMTKQTVFDLASLTKPLAVAPAVITLILQGKLSLEDTLGNVFPIFQKTDKKAVTIRHLLSHTSGLPDHRPYYLTLKKIKKGRRKDALNELLMKEPLVRPLGSKTVYSDLGFMILGRLIEDIAGMSLDQVVRQDVYLPMGLCSADSKGLFFNDLSSSLQPGPYAATECCPWRRILLEGQVHDDNAYVLGGIAGHAGLFGTAEAVYRLLLCLLRCYENRNENRLFPTPVVRLFFSRSGQGGRALGFDVPSPVDSSCGSFFSNHSVGHLGFTGTSFWMDLDRSIIVVLLTNRIHPSRQNNRIRRFRPLLHDAVMTNLLKR